MRILVIGATGTIGGAVVAALAGRHDVVKASRRGVDVQVDISQPGAIRAMFDRVGLLDAVVNCAGAARPGPLGTLTDEDFATSLATKLMGQINLVRFGLTSLRDGGSFTLTSGVFSQKPTPGVPAMATVNGAVESFGRAAALDLPRGLRLNVVSPPWIKETARKLGKDAPLSAAENALAYVRLVEGSDTGLVVYP
jgi:NAD(P)-dependent dehydrogenase (short-subunit alcohol dehydrogenase family)